MSTPRRRSGRGRGRKPRAAETTAPVPAEPTSETPLDTFLEPPPAPMPPTTEPEPVFAARVPPPAPERPRPEVRRAIFFDVENSSRVEHVARLLAHLHIDREARATDLVAVGNWRVVNQDTARMLAQRGALLVHSAPAAGVRDWSDLRIAVAAGAWVAAARPGDTLEIITDDQAFDAVGDFASSVGVVYRRLSYRALTGAAAYEPVEAPAKEARGGRRRRRGGRGRRREAAPVAAVPVGNGGAPEGEGHTAPHDELLAVARELIERAAERTVTIDALSNALKAHGFRRTPGSPRLITRLRRIKELDVSRTGAIRLVEGEGESQPAETGGALAVPAEPADAGSEPAAGEPAAPSAAPRRRRRRGGRRRRGRGGSHSAVVSP